MERLPALLLLLWLCSTFFVGIHLFVGGFLLVRVEVNRSSSCADALLPAASSRPDFCVGEARFRRAVLLVVDALRLDFALVRGGSAPFHDRLPVLQEVTSSRPERARLFAFRADPPTTTMQRIKGFTTGSLPTFVDVGNNFASSAILEDNLVRQLARAGKRVVFMGDDTWESLFPNQFHRSLPFPSFNVKDLHTVDDGILKHLYPTMEGSDWDVLIAHFLGVDHCGHRFGPDHPAMADKLAQMDRVIRSVMGRLQNDTLLVVMGDHGMTDTGDHGGESLKETDAALFLYSPSPVFPAALSQAEPEVVLQTDLVPTLALLLGVPIPYSSIGQVILPLFPQESETAGAQGHLSQLEALWVNAKQVNRFLETYSYVARDIPRESLFVLRDKFAALWNEYSGAAKGGRAASPALVAALQRYLTAVRDVCQATWAKFHPLKMASGIAILATACAVCFAVSEVSAGAGDSVAPRVPLATGAVAAAGVAAGQLASQGYVDAAWCLGAAVLSSQLTFLWGLRRSGGKGGAPARGGDPRHGAGRSLPRAVFSVPLLALALRCASLLSDSYVIAEGRVATFLLLSLGLYIPLRLNWEGLLLPSSPDCQKASGLLLPPSSPPPPSAARRESLVLLAGLGVLVASLYLSLFLHNCREEQGACNPSPLLVPLARVQDSSLRNVRYVLSVLSLSACAYGLRCWLRHYGNLNGPGAAVFAARWPLPLASLCTGLYWAVSSTPERSFRGFAELIALALVVLPRTAFAFLVLGTTLLWLNPLTVFLKPRQVPGQGKGPAPLPRYRASTALSPEAELHHLIPQLYQRMRRSLEDGESPGDSEGDGRPAVEAYGLGTVYSAPVVLLSGLLGSGLLLLHPEGMALAFLLLLVEGVALLHLHASFVKLTSLHGARQGDFSVPWLSVLLWDLAATQFFHATGHLPTFPSIQWGAAFVGFPQGHVGTLLPGSLVALNTFASHILFAVGCPLLLFWPLVCEIRAPQRGYGSSERDAVMEMRLRERPREFSAALLQLAARCFCVKGAQVLASALAAAILRRHLMVWKVFAPKLIFEAAGFVLASVFTLIGCALVLRVDFAVSSWFKKLIPEQCR